MGRKVSPREFNPFAKPVELPRISDPRLMALEDGFEVFTVQ